MVRRGSWSHGKMEKNLDRKRMGTGDWPDPFTLFLYSNQQNAVRDQSETLPHGGKGLTSRGNQIGYRRMGSETAPFLYGCRF